MAYEINVTIKLNKVESQSPLEINNVLPLLWKAFRSLFKLVSLKKFAWLISLILYTLLFSESTLSHGVATGDAGYLERINGIEFIPLMYLGAKHMVTGYDHLLFLAGVIFFLYRLKDIALYVSLFAIGHSITLLWGVLGGLYVNPFIVDAIIGLSVVYKGMENIGVFSRLGININKRAAVFGFGLAHGFGLATKLQGLDISTNGLIANMIAFNIGVEFGQFAALAILLAGLALWRQTASFHRLSFHTNLLIIFAGFLLCGYQITGFVVN